MTAIAFYISGHGFGHASRQKPILRTLINQGIDIYVRSGVRPDFFDSLDIAHHHHQHYDIGLIQPTALTVDAAASFAWYDDFLSRQQQIIQQEVDFIHSHNIKLIVSDIVPVAFEIADAAGIPSIAATHYTWDWVYEYYLDELPQYRHIVDHIREAYGKASLALEMPFAHELDMFECVEKVPLVVNPAAQSRAEVRTDFDVPDDKKMALLSMGGMQWHVDISDLQQVTDWVFLVTPAAWEQVKDLPNFRLVSTTYPHYHSILAAADVVISKAGWSTVAECVAHRAPIIYTIRDDWRENELLQAALHQYAHSAFVQRVDFERGTWINLLDSLYDRPYSGTDIPTNGVAVIARKIIDWCH